MAEYRLTVRIPMTPDQEDTYRADHTLGENDSTRDRLASTVHDELEGLGETSGWWEEVRVS
ncbi:hypothetical protein [Nocardiopsis lucentensis]|uniref:hypothetical protein n=1 Tax=Nocardiopsis lucentensis TaxID=53441 RepID=UPI00034D0297|nr:hypothetical protein [Nocardiopsis lucentensis]